MCGWLCRAGSVVMSLQNEKRVEENGLWSQAEQARKQRAASAREKDGVRGTLRAHHPGERRDWDEDDWGRSIPGSTRTLAGETPSLRVSAAGALSVEDLDRVVAALCALGGQFEDIYPGARVLCRLPAGEDGFERLSGWEERPTVEATVLRPAFSGTNPPEEETSDSGNPRASDIPASAQVDSIAEAQHPNQHQHVEAMPATRPVFSSRLLPRPPGCTRPLDIYQGLTDGVFLSTTAASAGAEAVVARHSVHEVGRLQELEQELQRRQQRLTQNARFGSVSSRPGRSGGPIDLSRELSPPAVRARADSLSSGGRRGDVAPMDGCSTGGDAAASTRLERQQPKPPFIGCTPLVTVGVAREGRGNAPRAVTVRTDEATPVRTGVPRALTKMLASHAKVLLPGLTAMLEAETAFRGASRCGLLRENLPSVGWDGAEHLSLLAGGELGQYPSGVHLCSRETWTVFVLGTTVVSKCISS